MKAARKLNQLFNETEKLLAELAEEKAPGVQEMRDKLEKSIAQTKDALSAQPPPGQVKLRDVAFSLNDYVRDFPWVALATGVLLASSIGILATTATRRSLRH